MTDNCKLRCVACQCTCRAPGAEHQSNNINNCSDCPTCKPEDNHERKPPRKF